MSLQVPFLLAMAFDAGFLWFCGWTIQLRRILSRKHIVGSLR